VRFWSNLHAFSTCSSLKAASSSCLAASAPRPSTDVSVAAKEAAWDIPAVPGACRAPSAANLLLGRGKKQVGITKGYLYIHYRNPRLCRVSTSLPSAFCRALGKEGFAESRFTECRTLGTGTLSAKTCLPSVQHSSKKALGKGPSAAVLKLTAVSLCREPRTGTRQRRLCRVSSIDTRQTIFFFTFWPPNFLCYFPTLCRPTCTILGQL
jgi:hypothetical protein